MSILGFLLDMGRECGTLGALALTPPLHVAVAAAVPEKEAAYARAQISSSVRTSGLFSSADSQLSSSHEMVSSSLASCRDQPCRRSTGLVMSLVVSAWLWCPNSGEEVGSHGHPSQA
jgi:hypothetical protein